MSVCEDILQLARWAPSGDNTQPWRFAIKGPDEVLVYGADTSDHCVYDLDGRASQIALGALLETIEIAASQYGLRAHVTTLQSPNPPLRMPWRDRPYDFVVRYMFSVRLVADATLQASPLCAAIERRTVQRRPFSAKALTDAQKSALQASVGPAFELLCLETLPERWGVAKLLFNNAKLRLTLREAYEVHASVIEWNAQFSEDRIPDQAIGVDPLTAKFMCWVMQSWPRVEFFNKWLAGTIMPRVQLDLIPALACAAHYGIMPKVAPKSLEDYVASGRAMQRFWLEVTRQGLWLQPEMTPVIFGRYHREDITYTSNVPARALGAQVAAGFTDLLGDERVRRLVVLARVGAGHAPVARSRRIPLSDLLWR
jgi:sulfur-carrier protein adenylyltransferase/sulfurtransferase